MEIIPASLWDSLSPTEFEELTFWILHREGFFNLEWYGESGSDKGRDIICQRKDILGPKVLVRNCVVQCKRYKGQLGRTKIHDDIVKNIEHNPDFFILVTSGIISAATKDWLGAAQGRFGMRIITWERTDLSILLNHHQDLRMQYLGIIPSTTFFLRNLVPGAAQKPEIENMFRKPDIKNIIQYACQLAIENSTLLTLAHLLVALIRYDKHTVATLSRAGFSPGEVALALERCIIKKEKTVKIKMDGLKITSVFRQALAKSVELVGTFGKSALSGRLLFLAILTLPRRSGTIIFLEEKLEISRKKLIKTLLDEYFTPEEIGTFFDSYEDIRDLDETGHGWLSDDESETHTSFIL